MKGREFGNYRLAEPLGRGGMGEVWRATHIRLDRPAAVKLIRPERLEDVGEMGLTALRRFEREAQATSRLKSPHTIEVYDFGTADDGTFYYAMELLEGLDLKSLVSRFGPVPAERAIHLLGQACESLEEAHRAGLVHRDIKPANLFACRLGLKVDVVKVLDFGLVKFAPGSAWEQSQLTTDGMAPGSPAYLAPEIAIGKGLIDARSDLYSLGCVAYWLLTGELVFTADTPLGVVLAHIEQPPDAPSTRTELPIPAALEALVLDCLQKKPDDRPANTAEVFERLGAVPVEESWTQERAQRWWRNHHPALPPTPPPSGQGPTATEPENPKLELAGAQRIDAQLEEERERTLHVLQDAFAHSRLDVNELSRRTELVQHATRKGQLDALVADLESEPNSDALVLAGEALPAPRPGSGSQSGALVQARRERQTIFAVMGGVSRKGNWRPARKVRAISLMGGTDLDFRGTKLPPGPTDIRCYTMMGGVDIIVPPELYVEVGGMAFMGGFEQSGHSEADPPGPDEPWLRVGGFAFMGAVDVKVKEIRPKGEGLFHRAMRHLFGDKKEPAQLEHDEEDAPADSAQPEADRPARRRRSRRHRR